MLPLMLPPDTPPGVLHARLHDVIREEDMQPIIKSEFVVGDKIKLTRPPIPPSNTMIEMTFLRTEQGWVRIPGDKPGCMTMVLAWGVGGAIAVYYYLTHSALWSSGSAGGEDDIPLMLAGICLVAGQVMWWVDWMAYKRNLQ